MLATVDQARTLSVVGSITVGTQPAAIATGDVNGDGLADLVVANRGDDSVTVLLATDAQSFSPGATLPTNAGPDGQKVNIPSLRMYSMERQSVVCVAPSLDWGRCSKYRF